jgi:hypothetical protein
MTEGALPADPDDGSDADAAAPAKAVSRFPGGALRPEEVEQLWSFLHGDVMNAGIRQHLRSALGLCPRHTWGYAVVEVELWVAGAGPREGHQPFDVCVLYEDLLRTVAAALSGRHVRWHRLDQHLRSQASCRICDYLPTGAQPEQPHAGGYAGVDLAAVTVEANALAFTTSWCQETQPVWGLRVCPACRHEHAGAAAAEPVGRGHVTPAQLCRRHLLVRAHVTPLEGRAVSQRLLDVQQRVVMLLQSMSAGAALPPPAVEASWIEALGWFAGWDLPLALASTRRR